MNAIARSDSSEPRPPDAASLFRAIFEQAAVGVAHIETATGRFLRVNPRCAAILGYSREELERLAFEALTDPDDLPTDFENMRRLMAGEIREFTMEKRCCHKDGRVVWVNLTVSPLSSPGKPPHFHIAVMEDITERKATEVALQESAARLREVIERAPFGVHSYELQFHHRLLLVGANPAADRILGIDHKPLLGRTIEEAFPGLRESEIPDTYRRLATSGGSLEKDQFIYEHGQIKGAFAIHAFHTGANRMTVFFSDITERKRAEEKLQVSKDKLDSIFRAAPIGMGVVSNRIFKEVNERICEMVGYGRAELLEKSARILYPSDEEFERVGQEKYAQLRERSTGSVETRWLRKDGKVIDVLLRSSPIDPNDWSRGVTFTALDITERKQAEEERNKLQSQLTQAQKVESVGRLAGGVAHDFNNMLQAILGNAALALQDLPADSPVRESLEEIEKSARRSADLTRQLLAFARKQTIQPKVLDLNDTVGGMLKMLRRLIGEDIDLAWMPGNDLWSIKMDPSQIDQILANLCVNARDAIAGTGKVTLETANVTLDDTNAQSHPDCVPGDYVLLAVSDTGKGMDMETRSHLFEPFFTTKDLGKGTGLGLATIFGIVKQNQGLITVYSEPGQGSTFKIYLPRAKAQALPAVAVTQKSDLPGTETVLLVEDEGQILGLAVRILQQHGYTVLAERSPEAALKLAKQHSGPIHLLVTDVVMPGMDGRELRKRLVALQPGLRCLYMSGYTADVIAHHGVLDEGVQFLQKPFTIQSLAERVRQALRQPLGT